jgi:hypothetical protein
MSKVVLYNEVIFNEKKNKEQKYKVFIFEINFYVHFVIKIEPEVVRCLKLLVLISQFIANS